MIYTNMDRILRYLGISETLDTAIRYLVSNDLTQLHMGRNEIDGDDVFVNRFDYNTMTEEEAIWEGHKKYGDIHVLLCGHEKIGVSDAASLKVTGQKEADDFVGYEGPVQTWCPMTTHDLLIVFPEDVHKVKVIDGESAYVKKACFKFKV